MANDKGRILRAALTALAGGALVALFNPAVAVECDADHGMAKIDRAAVKIVALVEPQPSPAARTAARRPQ